MTPARSAGDAVQASPALPKASSNRKNRLGPIPGTRLNASQYQASSCNILLPPVIKSRTCFLSCITGVACALLARLVAGVYFLRVFYCNKPKTRLGAFLDALARLHGRALPPKQGRAESGLYFFRYQQLKGGGFLFHAQPP